MEEEYYVLTKKESVEILDRNMFWGVLDDDTDNEIIATFLVDDYYDMGQRVTLVV